MLDIVSPNNKRKTMDFWLDKESIAIKTKHKESIDWYEGKKIRQSMHLTKGVEKNVPNSTRKASNEKVTMIGFIY